MYKKISGKDCHIQLSCWITAFLTMGAIHKWIFFHQRRGPPWELHLHPHQPGLDVRSGTEQNLMKRWAGRWFRRARRALVWEAWPGCRRCGGPMLTPSDHLAQSPRVQEAPTGPSSVWRQGQANRCCITNRARPEGTYGSRAAFWMPAL